MEFSGDVHRSPYGAAWTAPAEAAAIIRRGGSEAGNILLNVVPVQVGGGELLHTAGCETGTGPRAPASDSIEPP